MENFVNAVRSKINENMDWFEIGYEMVQYIIDKNKWNELGYCDFMNKMQDEDERLLFIILMKNLVSQVNNGGFSQYHFNGYASFSKRDNGDLDAHEYLIELYKKYVPKNDKTKKLLDILNNFKNNVVQDTCECCDGMGFTHEENECSYCNGNGYIDDEECEECGGSGVIEEECRCYECNGSGELDSYSYQGYYDDKEFYEIFDKDMENFFKELLLNWLENWDKDCILNQFKTEKNESNSNSKPKLKLVGTDGNAFSVLGRMIDCLRHHGYSSEELKAIKEEAISGDYNKVLATACKYCEVY